MIQTSFWSNASVTCRPGVAASQGNEPCGDPRESFTPSLSPDGRPSSGPYVCVETGKLHLEDERPPRPYVCPHTGKVHLPTGLIQGDRSSWTVVA